MNFNLPRENLSDIIDTIVKRFLDQLQPLILTQRSIIMKTIIEEQKKSYASSLRDRLSQILRAVNRVIKQGNSSMT
jgi:hypothetical protein